jgi:hypothetical protein
MKKIAKRKEKVIYEDGSFRLIKISDEYGLVEVRHESKAEGTMK